MPRRYDLNSVSHHAVGKYLVQEVICYFPHFLQRTCYQGGNKKINVTVLKTITCLIV